MIVFVFNHPVGCAVGLVIALYAVAFAALGWPFNDDRKRA